MYSLHDRLRYPGSGLYSLPTLKVVMYSLHDIVHYPEFGARSLNNTESAHVQDERYIVTKATNNEICIAVKLEMALSKKKFNVASQIRNTLYNYKLCVA
jgi:hypothetical protein